ncbi:MAG: hypothetical protein SGJ24_04435 [Chloroflexota bacterium]|nr:hypothetical protein [Chloroflexota bacterium]
MAARQSTKRIDTTDLQGEGSFVIVRPFTYGRIRDLQATAGNLSADEVAALDERTIIDGVQEWNWADEAGKALPLPAADASVVRSLTVNEFNFLSRVIIAGGRDPK